VCAGWLLCHDRHMPRARALLVVASAVALVACAATYTVEPSDDAGAPALDAGVDATVVLPDAGGAKDGGSVDVAVDEPKSPPDGAALDGVCGADCHVVFVSSRTYAGSALGGVAGADAKCQALAAGSNNAAIRARASRFAAWISSGNANDPGMTTRLPAAGRFHRTDDAAIAESVGELVSGAIRVTINLDEDGNPIQTGQLQGASWTGTQGNGKTSGTNCGGWMAAGGQGDIGRATSVDATWTNYVAVDCSTVRHLYCFDRF